MSAQPKVFMTPEEYLAHERAAEYKSEYWGGEVFAMSGASRRHNIIVGNVVASFHSQLRGRDCILYPSDMRIRVSPTGLYTYPDVTVVCGQEQFADEEEDTLLNPTVIVEVLSPSTESYDRGKKFQNYRTIDTLQEYILIAQDSYRIEHYRRQDNQQWLLTEATKLEDAVHLPSISCELALANVYEKVEFETQREGDARSM